MTFLKQGISMYSRNSFLLLLLIFPTFVRADGVVSGPDVDKKVPSLPVYDGTGSNKEKDVDYAAERKDKLTVYIFIQADKWDRPMARFLKKLDQAIAKDNEDAYLVAVWLTNDPDKTKDYLPIAQRSLQFQATALTCFTGDKTGPKDWNINADAHLTTTIATKGKVVSCSGFKSINETDVPAIMEAVKKALAKK
jgi:hypothetical protein